MAVNIIEVGKQLGAVLKTASLAKVDTAPITPPNAATGAGGLSLAPKAMTTKQVAGSGKANAFDTSIPTPTNPIAGAKQSAAAFGSKAVNKASLASRDLKAPAGFSITTPDGVIASRAALTTKLTGMSDSKIANLENMASGEFKKLKSVMTNPPTMSSASVVKSSISGINGMVSAGKSAIGHFKGLNSSVSCKNGPGAGGSNALVNRSVLDSVLGAGLCADPVNLLTSIKELNVAGYTTSGGAISGLVSAVKSNNTRSLSDKLSVLGSVKGVVTTPTGNDLADTKLLTKGLVEYMGTQPTHGSKSSLAFEKAQAALNATDPNYGFGINGEVSQAGSKGNAYLDMISRDGLTATSPAATVVSAQPTAPSVNKLSKLATVAANVTPQAAVETEIHTTPPTPVVVITTSHTATAAEIDALQASRHQHYLNMMAKRKARLAAGA